MRNRSLLCAVIGSMLPIPAVAQAAASDPFAGARAFIEQAMRDNDLPSIAAVVAKNGEVVFAEGFGWADLEQRIPATPRTMYSLASISKPMTATALMRFVQDGRIRLDRPANDYLPGGRVHSRRWNPNEATVQRVLSHSAGLPLHYEFFYEGEDHPPRNTDEGVSRYGILIAQPGTYYQYSNLGYGIIERMIEHVAGRSYADVMREELFRPLGMTRTTVSTGAGLADSVAVRYGPDNRPIAYYDFDHRGGSAVYSSALDLVRFGLYHARKLRGVRTIVADSLLLRMQQPVSAGATRDGYGLGWAITADDGGYRRMSHTGGMPGVSTVLNVYPDQGVVVAVLSNRSNGVVGRIAQELAGAVLPRYADVVRERREAAANRQAETRAAGIPPALAGEWSGRIHTPDDSVDLKLVIDASGDVHVQLGNELWTLLNETATPDGDRLVGRFAASMPDRHARRHSHSVLVNLKLEGDRLYGQATAQTTGWPYYFALTSFAELRKTATQAGGPGRSP